MNEKDMIRRLMLPRMTSQHMSWHELFTELNQDRNEAAEALRKVVAERDALRAELEALRGQDPALYVQSNHFANAKFAPFLARICQQPLSQIHTVPLYLAAGAQRVPAGWQLAPKTITAKMEAVYSNDSGAYQTAQALHDAMLAAAPKPEDDQ